MKDRERRVEIVIVPAGKPPDMTAIVKALAEKIKREGLINDDKRKI